MSNFFKSIRKSHLMKNNSKKYLKYAIGEIILVVIGILIALQINNWNEANKAEDEELKLLKQIQSDIKTNNEDILKITETLDNRIQNMDTVLLALKKKTYTLRSSLFLSTLHNKSFLNVLNSGYKQLGNSSKSLIKNDTILNKILELYEIDFDNAKRTEYTMHNHIDDKLYPLTNKYFEVDARYNLNFKDKDVNKANVYTPLNVENLYTNTEYKNTLHQLDQMYFNQRKQLKDISHNIQSLVERIDNELDSRY